MKGSSSAVVPMRPSSMPRAAPIRPKTAAVSGNAYLGGPVQALLTENAVPQPPIQRFFGRLLQVLAPGIPHDDGCVGMASRKSQGGWTFETKQPEAKGQRDVLHRHFQNPEGLGKGSPCSGKDPSDEEGGSLLNESYIQYIGTTL